MESDLSMDSAILASLIDDDAPTTTAVIVGTGERVLVADPREENKGG